jgi:hypothetical protein
MAVRSSSHLEDRLSVNGAPSTNRCRTTSGREHAGRITIRRMPDVAHPETRLSIRSERGFASGLAILLVAVTWLFVPQMASPFDIKRHLVCVGVLILTLQFLAQRTPAPWRMPGGIIGVALAALLFALALSTIAAENSYLAATQLTQIVPLLALLLCLFNLRDEATQDRIETGLLVVAAGVALLALKQWLLPDFLDPGFHALGKMRVYSTLGNPNLAAFALLAASPIAFFRAHRAGGVLRALYAALVLLLMIALLATQSRQALLIAGLLLPLGFVWLGSPLQRKLAVGALAIALALVAGAVTLQLVDLPATLIHTAKGPY